MKVLGEDWYRLIMRGTSENSKYDGSYDDDYSDKYYDFDWWDVGGYGESYPGWSDDS